MRVLHVCTSIDPSTGGPANVLARLARVQAEQGGHDVQVITADEPAAVQSLTGHLGGATLDAAGPMRGPFAKGAHTAERVEARLAAGIDVVHIHGLWQHAPHCAAAKARKAGVPYIFRPCGMLDPWSLNQGRLKKKVFLALVGKRDLNRAAALHYTTATEKQLVAPMRLTPRAYVIPNGLDWGEFETLPDRGVFRARYGIGDRTLVVFLSRVHHKKGLDLLLPAFSRVPDRMAMLAIVGPGETSYVEQLRCEAARLGIGDRVVITGMLSGLSRLEALRDADLFCLPSYQENFGVSVIEALGVGTPVLISDQVNIHREVAAAGVGEVVPCHVEPLALRLTALLADRARMDQMAAAARPWVVQTFRWDAIAAEIDSMYAQVCVGVTTEPSP